MRPPPRRRCSHTGALAGSDAAYNAIFRRAGLLRVKELGELFEAAEVLSSAPPLLGERLAILTNGGGAGVLAADSLADEGGVLAALAPATKEALDPCCRRPGRRAIPSTSSATRGPTAMPAPLEAVLADEDERRRSGHELPDRARLQRGGGRRGDRRRRQAQGHAPAAKPVLTNWLGDGAAARSRALFSAAGIPTFETPDAAINGFMQLVHYKRAQDELMQTPPSLPGGHALRSRARARHHRRGAAGQARDAVRGRGEGAAGGLRRSRRAHRDGGGPRRRRGDRRRHPEDRPRPAWSRSSPTTSRTSPTSAACGLPSRAPRRRARRRRSDAREGARPEARGAHSRLHGAADDRPPARARADRRHERGPDRRAAHDVRRRRHGGRGDRRHGARAAAARPEARAHSSSTRRASTACSRAIATSRGSISPPSRWRSCA